MASDKPEKKGWYPGKFMDDFKEKKRASHSTQSPETVPTDELDSEPKAAVEADEPTSTDNFVAPQPPPTADDSKTEDQGWFPGKIAKQFKEKRASRSKQSPETVPTGESESEPKAAVGMAEPASTDNFVAAQPPPATDDSKADDQGWFPGKIAKQFKEKRASAAAEAEAHQDETEREGWVPPIVRLRERFSSRKRGVRNALVSTPTCQVSISIMDIQGIHATRPYVEVGLQGTTVQSGVFNAERGLDTPFNCTFSISDVTADLYILFMEEYTVRKEDHCIGQIILPLVRYVGLKDPLPPKAEWVQIYPLGCEEVYGKHRSGVEKVAGSAMPSPHKPLGFVRVQVELQLVAPTVQVYLQGDTFNVAEMQDEERDEEGDAVIVPRVLKYNAHRLKRVMTSPPLLRVLFSWPGSLLLPVLSLTLSLFAEPWQLPWLLAAGIIINGYLVSNTRAFSYVILWENQVGKKDSSPLAKLRQIKGLIGAMQNHMGIMVSTMERVSNMWSWADPQVTVIAIAVLCAFCFVLSLTLLILPLRIQILCVTMAMSVLFVLKSIKVPGNNNTKTAAAAGTNEAEEAEPSAMKKYIGNFMERVPDNLELEHRYICETAVQAGSAHAASTKAKH